VIETYRNNGLRVQIEKLVPNQVLSDNKLSTDSLVSLKYEDLEVSQHGLVIDEAFCPGIAPKSSTGDGEILETGTEFIMGDFTKAFGDSRTTAFSRIGFQSVPELRLIFRLTSWCHRPWDG